MAASTVKHGAAYKRNRLRRCPPINRHEIKQIRGNLVVWSANTWWLKLHTYRWA